MVEYAYKLLVAPAGAQIPADVRIPIAEGSDIIEKILSSRNEERILLATTRELPMLIEYRDVIPLELRALVGVNGTIFATIWASFISPITAKVTVHDLILEQKRSNDERADSGQRPKLRFQPAIVGDNSDERTPGDELEDDPDQYEG
jgi:hypothetical protein